MHNPITPETRLFNALVSYLDAISTKTADTEPPQQIYERLLKGEQVLKSEVGAPVPESACLSKLFAEVAQAAGYLIIEK